MSKVTVGTEKISLADVINVGQHKFEVVVEPAVMKEVNESYAKRKAILGKSGGNVNVASKTKITVLPDGAGGLTTVMQGLSVDNGPSGENLSVAISRSLVFLRCVAIAQGRSGIGENALSHLVLLLNNDLVPALSVEDYFANRQILEALEKHYAENLRLEAFERKVLERANPSFVTTASLAFAVYELHGLVDVADAVAALSCEAAQACRMSFESDFFEKARPHRGACASAKNIRLMLQGSQQAAAKPPKKGKGKGKGKAAEADDAITKDMSEEERALH
jgi:histidine ammonia-lyase